jgi:hypothetical protein
MTLACALVSSLIALGTERGATVSDDDFARVLIAQSFARAPSWDPSGTSWLPFPFFVDGGAMLLFGAELEVARAAAVSRSALGACLLFLAGWRLGLSSARAAVCALAAALLPTTWIFTAATVPEYFTACLATFALIALSPQGSTASRLVGLACLTAATLSRYETWPFALALAVSLWLRRTRQDFLLGLACLTGPALWCLHGALHHGSPFFFVTRVRSYKLALGPDPRTDLETFFTYGLSLVRSEPLLLALLAFSIALARKGARRRAWLFLTPLLAQLLFLSLADLASGSPTHHPERTLMAFWTTLPLLIGLNVSAPRPRALRLAGNQAPRLWLTLPPLLLLLNASFPRPSADFVDRRDEVAIGRALRSLQGAPQKTWVGALDFSHLAIMAAAGSPERFLSVTTGDPRDSSQESLVARARSALSDPELRWLILPICIDRTELTRGPSELLLRHESRDYQILERR